MIFAIRFFGLGAAGCYLSMAKNNAKLALLVALRPWALALVVLFITLVTSDYK